MGALSAVMAHCPQVRYVFLRGGYGVFKVQQGSLAIETGMEKRAFCTDKIKSPVNARCCVYVLTSSKYCVMLFQQLILCAFLFMRVGHTYRQACLHCTRFVGIERKHQRYCCAFSQHLLIIFISSGKPPHSQRARMTEAPYGA